MTFDKELYLISKNKIEVIPESLKIFSESIYDLGETKTEQREIVSKSNLNFRKIYSILSHISFEFRGVAFVKNGTEALISEFILKESFDVIITIDSKLSEKILNFINAYLDNFKDIRARTTDSYRSLISIESYIEKYADNKMDKFFNSKVNELSEFYNSLSCIEEDCISYLKPDIIKYIKF